MSTRAKAPRRKLPRGISVNPGGRYRVKVYAEGREYSLGTYETLTDAKAAQAVAKGDLAQGIEIGDHAGIKWLNGSCLACEFCKTSDEPLCAEAQLSGYTVDGTFQQYAIVPAEITAKVSSLVALPPRRASRVDLTRYVRSRTTSRLTKLRPSRSGSPRSSPACTTTTRTASP